MSVLPTAVGAVSAMMERGTQGLAPTEGLRKQPGLGAPTADWLRSSPSLINFY